MLAGVTLILWGLRLWGYGTLTGIVVVPTVVLVAWGLLLLATPPRIQARAGAPAAGTRWRVILLVTVGLMLVALALWAYTQTLTAPAYGTDEMAFDQWAAHLLLQGHNPYGHSLAAAFAQYQVSPNGYTWTLAGRPVTTLSYPALSFLIYVPFLAIMGHGAVQLAVWVNVAAWGLGVLLMLWALPPAWKPLAVVLGSLGVYTGYVVGGVTDALFVPLLAVAAFRWDRYPTARRGAQWWGPVAMGLAMSIKQTPWLVLPFVLLGILAESREAHTLRWRPAMRYALIATATFAAVNLPFVLANPSAWVTGVLLPFRVAAVPDGQGLISLALFLNIGGGSLAAFTALSILVLLGLLTAYWLGYPRAKAATFLLPSLALFFATRSFGSYLVMLVPPAVVAMATMHPIQPRMAGRLRTTSSAGRRLLGGLAAAAAIALVAALAWPSPLAMRVVGIRTTGQLATVDQVTVAVTNRTGRRIHPHFTADVGGTLTAFWHRTAGPSTLRAGETAHYVLAAPNFYAMAPLSSGFQVVGFATTPGTVSRTAPLVPTTWHVALEPDAVNRPVAAGQPVSFQAQVLNQLDQPVRVAQVPVYLGQIVYAESGLQYGEARVNRGYPGETPRMALTNARGQARFTVVSPSAHRDPIYFEANLVNSQDYYPYGYSQIVPVRFGGPS